MAWNDLVETINITSLADGEAVLLDRQSQEADTGWDSMRDQWLIRKDSAELDPEVALASFAATLGRGIQVTGKTMWIQSRKGTCRARGLFLIEVVSMGLLSARGVRVRYDAGPNVQSADNVNVPGVGRVPHAVGRESQVTCDVEYVVVGGPSPGSSGFYTADVGSEATPGAWTPAVKDSIWETIEDYTYYYPNGWVKDSAQVENLPGLSTVWLVRERYQYLYAASP
ncbi:hypothetical protein HNR46_001345 [Haloferula luteola]|uniref:Uncharacterized protein n=1 Tax=Haloferula luteola TaxID=595692 RepID=A0A840VE48_9BACT|nr:hypothetical protein [Haloferula luteola]MBB5351111.1 hypothetical protein [Haloferula luteola]